MGFHSDLFIDRVVFGFTNLSIYPSVHGAANPAANPIVHGWTGDWASSSPSTIVVVASQNGSADESSTLLRWRINLDDDGHHCHPVFPARTGAGALPPARPTNWVLYPSPTTPRTSTTRRMGQRRGEPPKISGSAYIGRDGVGLCLLCKPPDRLCRSSQSQHILRCTTMGHRATASFAGVYKS